MAQTELKKYVVVPWVIVPSKQKQKQKQKKKTEEKERKKEKTTQQDDRQKPQFDRDGQKVELVTGNCEA